MPRLLFSKTGEAVWMSHLDLMRLFQRAFKRAGLPLTHTQGYSPRPSVSIALPLSVGVESLYELLDFDLEGEKIPCGEITSRLNEVLVPGIRVLETYEDGRKIKDIAFLECRLYLEYDRVITAEDHAALTEFFNLESLVVEKKGKNGPVEQDIRPMIQYAMIVMENDHCLLISTMVNCQNPSLNPLLIASAIERYAPELMPDHVLCRRLKLYDHQVKPFR